MLAKLLLLAPISVLNRKTRSIYSINYLTACNRALRQVFRTDHRHANSQLRHHHKYKSRIRLSSEILQDQLSHHFTMLIRSSRLQERVLFLRKLEIFNI